MVRLEFLFFIDAIKENYACVCAKTLGIILMMLLSSFSVVNIQKVKALDSDRITIKADGSVFPSTAPITIVDNVTYILADDINATIIVERSNIIIDGNGYMLQGSKGGSGFNIAYINNVTIKNMKIKEFEDGISIDSSSYITIYGNEITTNVWRGIKVNVSFNVTISGNNITDNFSGIALWNHTPGSRITNNTITKNRIGMDVESDSNHIYGNTIKNNTNGITLYYSLNNTISGNVMKANKYNLEIIGNQLSHYIHRIDTSNTVDGKPVYHLINQKNLTISPTTHPQVGHLALVNCDNITVEGLTLTNNAQGILVAYTNNSRIIGNTIKNNSGGIHLERSHRNIISNNIVVNNTFLGYHGEGIFIDGSFNKVFGNNVSQSSTGIIIPVTYRRPNQKFENQYNNVSNNIVKDNEYYGILVGGHPPIEAEYPKNNIVSNNIVSNSKYGIDLTHTERNLITNNTITNNTYGLYSGGSKNILRNNKLENNKYNFHATWYRDSSRCNDVDTSNTVNGKPIYYLIKQSNIVIDSSTYPKIGYLGIIDSTNVTVKYLTLENNSQGLLFVNVKNSIIKNVEVSNNLDGICLGGSKNNSIISNTIVNNERGIRLESSGYNIIDDNFLSNNAEALYLHGADSNFIHSNDITKNGQGIAINYSRKNNIYHNNLINNTRQRKIYSTDPGFSSINKWDNGYPSGGNYWSDYTGVDEYNGPGQDETGGDFIVDIPYTIDKNNQDNYPLMYPFTKDMEEIRIAYRNLLLKHFEMQSDVDALNTTLYELQETINSLNSTCRALQGQIDSMTSTLHVEIDSVNSTLQTLIDNLQETMMNEIANIRNLLHFLTGITLILIATTVYLAIRKLITIPKTKTRAKPKTQ